MTATPSSLDDPHLRALRWCLAASFAAMGVAVGWKALAYPGSFFSFLFMTCGWSESAALLASSGAAWVLIAASIVSPWRGAWPALIAIAGWMAWLTALAMTGAVEHPALVPGERAVRILAPLALAWLIATARGGSVPPGREHTVVWLLRVSVAATFACHGLEALACKPDFLDYIFAAGDRLLGREIEQETAESMLLAIGAVDLVAALAIVIPRRQIALAAAVYMALWGFITAASRTVHSGSDGLFDSFTRTPNGGVPLALVLYWWLERPRE